MAKRQSICKRNHAVCIHMVKTKDCSNKNEHMAEHMVDHMYNINNIKKYDTKIWIRTDLDRHSDLHWDKPDSDYIKKYYRRPDMQEHGKWVLDRLKGLVELPIEG